MKKKVRNVPVKESGVLDSLNRLSRSIELLPEETARQMRQDLDALRASMEEQFSRAGASAGQPLIDPARLTEILYNINDGFYTLDREWHFTFINQRAAEYVGHTPEDLVGKVLWDVFPILRGTDHETNYRQAMENHTPSRFEMVGLLNPNWYEIKVYPTQEGIAVYWQNINDRKQLEQERERLLSDLEESHRAAESAVNDARQIAREARMAAMEAEAVFNNLAEAVIVYSPDGIVQQTNSYAIAMLGFDPLRMSRDAVLQRLQMFGEDGRPLASDAFPAKPVPPGDIVINYPLIITNRHGRTYSVLASALPLYIGKEYLGVVEMMKDITQREALLAENRRQRVLLEQVIQAAPVGIAILDEPGHRYSLINPYYAAHTAGKGEMIGKAFREVWAEVSDDMLSLLDSAVETGQPYAVVDARFDIVRDHGLEETYFSFSLTPLIDKDGLVHRLMIMATETTEQVVSRRQREADQALMKAVFENAPISISVVEGSEMRYILANPAAQASAPDSETGLVGRSVSAGFPANLSFDMQAALQEVLNLGLVRRWRGIHLPAGPEGRPAWWNIDHVPLPGPEGAPNRVLILAQEVTEQVLGHQRLEGEVIERRRIERALRESQARLRQNEERLRLATEAGEIGVWEQDLRTNTLSLDPLCRVLFGLSADAEITIDRYKALVFPEDFDRVNRIVQKVIREGGSYEAEYRVIWPDGSLHWLYERGRGDGDAEAGGVPTCLTGVVLDVTELKQAQAERERLLDLVAAEHSRLEAVLQSLPVAVWIADASGQIISKNAAADEIWGGTAPLPDDIAAYNEFRAWLPGQKETIFLEERSLVRALRDGKRPPDQELEIERFDGTRGTIIVSAAPVFDSSGHQVGAVSVNQDITERKQAERDLQESEAALRESETRFHMALENAPIAVFGMDTELRYTWVYNPRGFLPEDMVGRRDDEVFDPVEALDLMSFKRTVLESDRGMRGEFQARVNGELLNFTITAEPLRDPDGKTIGLTGAALDITEQRRLEASHVANATQMEVQRRLLEHREMERQQIARELHDGPIQDLIGLMFILQSALTVSPEGEVGEILLGVRQGAQKLVGELRSVCNELRPPALMQFGLERAIRSHAMDFQERNPNLSLNLALEEDGRLLTDSQRLALYRIYQEALNNLFRHSHANRATVRLMIDPGMVVLEIEDNGRGFDTPVNWIDMARQGHLGLVGMKERAEAIGGTLTVTSQPGAGARVRVEAPRR